MPGSFSSPCSGLSLTHSSVPYGTRNRNPFAAIVALSHVQRDRARQRQAVDRAGLVAQLPVAVVDGGDGARAHDALQLVPVQLGDLGHRLLQGDLDLGQGRDRHPDGQVVVQHVILAQIGVGQDEIAQGLAVPQARAMAHHQPDMRAQHRDVVGRCLGVGRADADIDQGDPLPVRAFQVISRHLRQLG